MSWRCGLWYGIRLSPLRHSRGEVCTIAEHDVGHHDKVFRRRQPGQIHLLPHPNGQGIVGWRYDRQNIISIPRSAGIQPFVPLSVCFGMICGISAGIHSATRRTEQSSDSSVATTLSCGFSLLGKDFCVGGKIVKRIQRKLPTVVASRVSEVERDKWVPLSIVSVDRGGP